MKLWLCEKPSQGRDVAAALGILQKNDGYIETRDGMVTWAIGHLFEEAPPDAYGEEFKKWGVSTLPIIPEEWKMLLKPKVASQFKIIQKLLKKTTQVVIATDPDAEGERIGRNILIQCKYNGPIQRLWSGSMLEESLKKAFKQLKPGSETEGYYEASLARSRGDWLVGMNFTRYFTLLSRERNPLPQGTPHNVMRIGRVKTPTLWLVQKREEEIQNFKPRDYYELSGHLNQMGNETGVNLIYAPREENERIFDKKIADELVLQCTGVDAPLKVEMTPKKTSPPKPFSLFDLQRYANSAWNWTAEHTLNVAQALYEKHKATTYPRTDCGFLPEESIEEVPRILKFLESMPEFSETTPVVYQKNGPHFRKTTFDSKKVTAHHGIIPTLEKPNLSAMDADETKAYIAIARRFIATLSPDYEYNRTVVSLEPKKDVVFTASGSVTTFQGWKAHYQGIHEEDISEEDEGGTFPQLESGMPSNLKPIDILSKVTKAPPYYTESTLLGDMKGIKKFVEDPELKKILNEEEGIGTEATRSNIIKELKAAYLRVEKKKYLRPTATGTKLIHLVLQEIPRLCDPGETALWEKETALMREHGTSSTVLINKIADQIKQAIGIGKEKNPGLALLGGGGSEPKDTGKTTDAGVSVFDCGTHFDIPNVCKVYKILAGAEMNLQDALDIANNGKSTVKTFKSRENKPFTASLVLTKKEGKPKLEFVFDTEPSTPTGIRSLGGHEVLVNSRSYVVPDMLQMAKTVCKIQITPENVADMLDNGHIGPFNFTKNDNSGTFTAFLVLKNKKAEFQFDNGQFSKKTQSREICPLSGEPLLETADGYFSPAWPQIKIPKVFKERPMEAIEVVQILDSGRTGVRIEGLVSKEGKKYGMMVRFSPEKNPWPGLELIFEDKGNGPARKTAKKATRRK